MIRRVVLPAGAWLLFATLTLPAWAVELRRGPFLQMQRPEGVTIRWRTDKSTEGPAVVRYGTSPDDLNQAVGGQVVSDHFENAIDWQATLDGLKPNTKYFYDIEVSQVTLAGADATHYFRTLPPTGSRKQPLRFFVLGDSGPNRAREGKLEDVLKMRGPSDVVRVRNGVRKFNEGRPYDGIFLLGDNAYPTGADSQWQTSFFQVYADDLRHTPVWPCTGNHDLEDVFQHIFSVDQTGSCGGAPSGSPYYYSFNAANAHIVVLDPWKCWWQYTTEKNHEAWRKQVEWLKRDLAANKQDWLILINHFPVYCDGNYSTMEGGLLLKLREDVVPLLEEHGLDLFLAGHDHTYQRSCLLDGLYGADKDYDPDKHAKDPTPGRERPYQKSPGGRQGAVYAVSGASGGTRPSGKFQHPAMVPLKAPERELRNGLATPGTLVIELDGDTLRCWFVDPDGKPLDEFTIQKKAS